MSRRSIETLAGFAGVDSRTFAKMEEGKDVQYERLVRVANALKVPVNRLIKQHEGEESLPSHSDIQICDDWEPSWRKIESAQDSILIIDSFFANEHGRLRPALRKNAGSRTKTLTVSVYMTSHEREFGPQRMRELDNICKGKPKLSASFTNRITQGEFRRYEEKFRDLVGPIQQSGDGLNAKVTLFEYFCLPSLRIIVVDTAHFFWSWFPLGAQHPSHVCFYLHDTGNLNPADRELCKWLNDHADCVMRLSNKTTVRARPNQFGRETAIEK